MSEWVRDEERGGWVRQTEPGSLLVETSGSHLFLEVEGSTRRRGILVLGRGDCHVALGLMRACQDFLEACHPGSQRALPTEPDADARRAWSRVEDQLAELAP